MPSALITLTTAGTGTGPFDLYSNVGGYAAPFETNVPKSSLVSGYTSNSVTAGTTIIRVQSTSVGCPNYVDISVAGITTTTTSTSTTSTTTPGNSSLKNNKLISIGGTFVFSVKIGAGSFNTVYSTTTTIAAGATLSFGQTYYPGSFNTTGNTFKVDVYNAVGISSSNYIKMFSGSLSATGPFTVGTPSTAQTYSVGNQFALTIELF
jgi:hypothetical protein